MTLAPVLLPSYPLPLFLLSGAVARDSLIKLVDELASAVFECV